MLRLAIWLLLLANAVYFSWTQGYLSPLGLTPSEQTEPARLQGQIKPDSVRLLNGPKADAGTPTTALLGANPPPKIAGPTPTPPEPSPAPSPEPPSNAAEGRATGTDIAASTVTAPVAAEAPATACWQATAFTADQVERLRSALENTGLSRGSWRIEDSRTGGRWVVYMGRYNDEQLDRKRDELKQLGVAFRTLPPPLGPGLALGTYTSEAAAELGLQDVSKKGVRTARVVQERAEGSTWVLRLPSVTEAQRKTVAGLGPAMAGKTLRRCD